MPERRHPPVHRRSPGAVAALLVQLAQSEADRAELGRIELEPFHPRGAQVALVHRHGRIRLAGQVVAAAERRQAAEGALLALRGQAQLGPGLEVAPAGEQDRAAEPAPLALGEAAAREALALEGGLHLGGAVEVSEASVDHAEQNIRAGAGRQRVERVALKRVGHDQDRYAFRTPPLRNVELTAPYGHNGAFFDLREFVAHYSESHLKLNAFDGSGLEPALQGTLLHNFDDILATRDTLLNGVFFAEQTIDEVTEFMKALTDPAARDLSAIVPASVPSGLPVDQP